MTSLTLWYAIWGCTVWGLSSDYDYDDYDNDNDNNDNDNQLKSFSIYLIKKPSCKRFCLGLWIYRKMSSNASWRLSFCTGNNILTKNTNVTTLVQPKNTNVTTLVQPKKTNRERNEERENKWKSSKGDKVTNVKVLPRTSNALHVIVGEGTAVQRLSRSKVGGHHGISDKKSAVPNENNGSSDVIVKKTVIPDPSQGR